MSATLGILATVPTAGLKLKHLIAAAGARGIDAATATAAWPAVQAARDKRIKRAHRRRGFDLLSNTRARLVSILSAKRRDRAIADAVFARRSQCLHEVERVLRTDAASAWGCEARIAYRHLATAFPGAHWSVDSVVEVYRERRTDMRRAAQIATIDALAARLQHRHGYRLAFESSVHGGYSLYVRRDIPGRGYKQIRISDHELPSAEDRPWSIRAQERSRSNYAADLVIGHDWEYDWLSALEVIADVET